MRGSHREPCFLILTKTRPPKSSPSVTLNGLNEVELEKCGFKWKRCAASESKANIEFLFHFVISNSMKFAKPLVEGVFLKRYKRFFADVLVNGETIVAHVPNSGSMEGCKESGSACLVSKSDDPKRKLQWTLEFVKTQSTWIGVNTSWPNKIVEEAFTQKQISRWFSFTHLQREVKISDETRLDFVLFNQDLENPILKVTPELIRSKKKGLHFIEVKNVSMGKDGVALFPDAVTTRGQKHLRELTELVERGHTAEVLFVIQRDDCQSFKAAHEIDEDYAKLLVHAHEAGVGIFPHLTRITPHEIILEANKELPISFHKSH